MGTERLKIGRIGLNPPTHCFFWGEISSNFDFKNMISTYSKDFPWKKWPKFARFQFFFSKFPNIYD